MEHRTELVPSAPLSWSRHSVFVVTSQYICGHVALHFSTWNVLKCGAGARAHAHPLRQSRTAQGSGTKNSAICYAHSTRCPVLMHAYGLYQGAKAGLAQRRATVGPYLCAMPLLRRVRY
eukprot:3940391-Rhodomonas_salina.3